MGDFAGKTGNSIIILQRIFVFINILMRNISSAILLSIFRQLDVFDGAGSGDGIDGRLSTTSEKMLVIMINIESIISRYLRIGKATKANISSI